MLNLHFIEKLGFATNEWLKSWMYFHWWSQTNKSTGVSTGKRFTFSYIKSKCFRSTVLFSKWHSLACTWQSEPSINNSQLWWCAYTWIKELIISSSSSSSSTCPAWSPIQNRKSYLSAKSHQLLRDCLWGPFLLHQSEDTKELISFGELVAEESWKNSKGR